MGTVLATASPFIPTEKDQRLTVSKWRWTLEPRQTLSSWEAASSAFLLVSCSSKRLQEQPRTAGG